MYEKCFLQLNSCNTSVIYFFPHHIKQICLLSQLVRQISHQNFESSTIEKSVVSHDANQDTHSAYKPRHEKTGFLHMGKQRRRSASQ